MSKISWKDIIFPRIWFLCLYICLFIWPTWTNEQFTISETLFELLFHFADAKHPPGWAEGEPGSLRGCEASARVSRRSRLPGWAEGEPGWERWKITSFQDTLAQPPPQGASNYQMKSAQISNPWQIFADLSPSLCRSPKSVEIFQYSQNHSRHSCTDLDPAVRIFYSQI